MTESDSYPVGELSISPQTNASYIPLEQLQLLSRLQSHLQAGGTMANFEFPQLPNAIASVDRGPTRLERTHSLGDLALLIQVFANALQPTDPLAHFAHLERAAAAGWILSTSEIQQLTGIKPRGDKTVFGSFSLVKSGRIGNQSAWKVVKTLFTPDTAQWRMGPVGGLVPATDFEIAPPETALQSRIKRLRIHAGWAIGSLQVQYENLATNPPEFYESMAVGGQGGNLSEFIVDADDYLTHIYGTWGSQAPGYPQQEIITLQFQTAQGLQSQVFGGGSGKQQVQPFCFEAPQGYEIMGFFGAHGSNQNVLVRLGVHLSAMIGVKPHSRSKR